MNHLFDFKSFRERDPTYWQRKSQPIAQSLATHEQNNTSDDEARRQVPAQRGFMRPKRKKKKYEDEYNTESGDNRPGGTRAHQRLKITASHLRHQHEQREEKAQHNQHRPDRQRPGKQGKHPPKEQDERERDSLILAVKLQDIASSTEMVTQDVENYLKSHHVGVDDGRGHVKKIHLKKSKLKKERKINKVESDEEKVESRHKIRHEDEIRDKFKNVKHHTSKTDDDVIKANDERNKMELTRLKAEYSALNIERSKPEHSRFKVKHDSRTADKGYDNKAEDGYNHHKNKYDEDKVRNAHSSTDVGKGKHISSTKGIVANIPSMKGVTKADQRVDRTEAHMTHGIERQGHEETQRFTARERDLEYRLPGKLPHQKPRSTKMTTDGHFADFMETYEPSYKKKRNRLREKNKKSENSLRLGPMKDFNRPGSKISRSSLVNVDMTDYFSPYSIAKQLMCLQRHNGTMASVSIDQEIIGRTAEYNDIVLWKIKEHSDYFKSRFRASDNHKYEDDVNEKKIIFIVHALNTMGWQHLPCLAKISEFKKLLAYYFENLDSFDIFLIPMANPDGVNRLKQNKIFANNERHDFEWNKNYSPQENCFGVTLDRNFDVAWNVSLNVSSCSPLYPGPSPFSEKETKAIRDVFHLYGNKIVAYFHVHGGTYNTESFKGDAVLYPKGFTDIQTDDDKYIDLRGEIDEALRNASFKIATVTVDTLHSWYGRVGGSSVDYASTIYGIPYAMELVMQVYKDDFYVSPDWKMDDLALTEVWQVVLDVIFDHIYRTEVKPNEKKCDK